MVRGYSELRVILTARNEASRTLRSVSRDLGKLGGKDVLQNKIKQLQNTQKSVLAQKALAEAEHVSLTSGQKRLALDARIANQKNAVKRAQAGVKAALLQEDKLTSSIYERKLLAEKRMNEVQKALRAKNLDAERRANLLLEEEALQTRQRRLAALEKAAPLKTTAARSAVITQNKALASVVASADVLAAKAEAASSRVQVLGDKAGYLADEEARVRKELDSLSWRTFEQGSKSAFHFGTALATVGAIGTISFGLLAKGAAQFSSQLTLAATQARPIGQSFAASAGIAIKLNDIVLAQMQKFPASSQEMADSLYQIFSGTNIQRPAEAAKILETFNKAAVAGGASLETMTQAGITLLNNFVGVGKEFKNLNGAFDFFFSSVRYGRMTAEQFASALGSIVPTAQTAGLGLRDIGTALAFITRQSGGKFTQRDATGLARLIDVFSRSEVQQGLKFKGVQVEKEGGGMRPILDIIKDIKREINPKTGSEINQFFKTISALGGGAGSKGLAGTAQARRIFQYLMQDLKGYNKTAADVTKTQGEFNKSYRAMAQAPGVRFNTLVNQFKAMAIVVGEQAIPTFEKLGFAITRVIKFFNDMNPHTRETIIKLGVFASVAALIGGIVTAAVSGLIVFGFAISKVAKAFTGLGKVAPAAAAAVEETAGAVAAVEGAGAAKLASDAGSLAVKFGLWGGAAAALFVVLTKYPHVLLDIVHLLGGFQKALTLLTLVGLTNSLFKLTVRATAATEALSTLRLALLRLSALGIIIIGYELVAHQEDLDNLEKRIKGKLAGVPLIGGAFKGQELKWQDLFDPDQVDKMANTFGMDFVKKLQDKMSAQMRARARSAGMSLSEMLHVPSPTQMKQALDTQHGMPDVEAAWQRLRELSKAHQSAKKISAETDADFIKGVRNLAKLQAAIDKAAPGMPLFHALKRYDAALAALTRRFPMYKDLINELVGAFNKLADIRMPDAQFAKAFARVRALQKAAEKSTDPKVIEKAHKAEDALAKRSADTQMQAAQEAADNANRLRDEQLQKTKDAAEKAAETAKRNVENAKNAIETMAGTVFQFYQNALAQNQTQMGQLFNGPFMNSAVMQNRNQFGFSARPQDILADAFSQLKQFSTFRRSLDNLRSRGAPAEMIDQIQQLGPEAQKQIDILNKFTPEQFKKYVGFFTKRQQLVERATQEDLKRQIKKWESFGKKVMRAIMMGISSETPGVQNAIYNMILKMFPGLAAQAHLKPKPTTFPGTRMTSTGTGGGKSRSAGFTDPNTYTVVHKTVHYNLPTHLAHTSLPSQLKAAYFLERNRD